MKTHIYQRVIFAESAATGKPVIEIDPKSLAAKEIYSLTKEICT